FGISSMMMTQQVSGPVYSTMDSETLRANLLDYIDAWQLENSTDQSQFMNLVWQRGYQKGYELASPSDPVPFEPRNTFNFTNSNYTFGNFVMTSDEVNSNLRNYIFQLLYNDIEIACEVSVLDIALFRVFDSLIIDWIDMEFAGFCNGFAQAARDFYEDPDLIPLGRDWAIELPSPSPNATLAQETHGDVVEAMIKEYVLWKGSGAFFNPNHLLNWVKIYLGIPTPQGGITNSQEIVKMMDAMLVGTPHYTPAVVLLMAPFWEVPEPTESHFVNVYDYEVNANGSITLYIYNNWYTFNSTYNMYDDWILVDANGNFKGTHGDPDSNFSRLAFYPDTSEYNSIFTALMDLLPKLLGFGIFSPVDIEITDPLGRKIGIGDNGQTYQEFPAIMVEDEGEKQVLFPFVPGLPYTVNLTGTDVGEYKMETHRMVDNALVSEEIVGTTEPGQNDLFTVTLDNNGIEVAEIGVYLKVPTIRSATAVSLEWSRFNKDSEFVAYEVYYSKRPNELGTLYRTINDIDTTSTTVGGLTPETTYFFTVRVTTHDDTIYNSNKVGASLPEDYTVLLLIAAGAGGFAILLLVIFLYRRRQE
ncbi:MAG: fibronectin type III domain-containing protein, partial [Candidatus Thorarchaeota archaeon]